MTVNVPCLFYMAHLVCLEFVVVVCGQYNKEMPQSHTADQVMPLQGNGISRKFKLNI